MKRMTGQIDSHIIVVYSVVIIVFSYFTWKISCTVESFNEIYKLSKKKFVFIPPLLVTVSIFFWPYLALRLIYEVLAEIFHILYLKLKFYLNQNENQNKFKVNNFNGKK